MISASRSSERPHARRKTQRDREQRRIDKAAEQKAKEKAKALAQIARLPSGQHEAKLSDLARKLHLELHELREEFASLIETERDEETPSLWDVEPWPDPVTTVELLQALIAKINKHVALHPHEPLVIALWTLMSWVHEVAATHSPFLVGTSADPEAGKSTLLEALFYMTPRPATGTEITAANLARFVDREEPTLITDEADNLFPEKGELTTVVNTSWTKALARVPKLVPTGGGQWVTKWFSSFCPKAFGLIGLNLPKPLVGRSIIIKLWPKLPGVAVSFDHADDAEFDTIRRKGARWAADHGAALKTAKPLQPAGFDNRLADNWRLLFAIAELAGETWAQDAREAAERLARTRRKPSWRKLLLQTIATIGAGKEYILSADLVAELIRDPTSPWQEYPGYRRIGKITQRQVADLLEALDIFPSLCGPKRLSGYKLADFAKAFAHYRVQPSQALARKQTKKKKGKANKRRQRG